MNMRRTGQWFITVFLLVSSPAISLRSTAQERKEEPLTQKQILAVLDCITRPGKIVLSKNYSGEGLRFRYSHGKDSPDSLPTMGLILYKAGGRNARYYMFHLDWSQECPVVRMSNGADLYREKGRWHSDIPFWFGGLGTMEAFAELPDEYASRKVQFVPAGQIKRTCAKYDEGG